MVHADYGQLLLDGMRPEQQIRATARASPDGSNLVVSLVPLFDNNSWYDNVIVVFRRVNA